MKILNTTLFLIFYSVKILLPIESESNFHDSLNAFEFSIEEILETYRKPKSNKLFDNIDFYQSFNHKHSLKEWTFLIYIAGDNDLFRFAIRNIEQMKQLGSSEKINILIHFDYHEMGSPKETRRFYVEKNKLIQIGNVPPMDSGDPKTLTDASQWAINNYPSRFFGLCMWNHGTGPLNPRRLHELINPSDLFKYNPITRLIEIDRSIHFIDYLDQKSKERGICFDMSTGNYLDDQKLKIALKNIVTARGGKKIDVLLMDACLMGCLEIAATVEEFADYLCASQEVVLGPGYNYTTLLKPLLKGNISPFNFASHVISDYQITYGPITQDFTQGLYDLQHTKKIIALIDQFANATIPFLHNKNILKTIQLSAKDNVCTRFDEPSYADIKHFFENLLFASEKISNQSEEINEWFQTIKPILHNFNKLFPLFIPRAVSGKNVPKAYGLSIYFPQNSIHPSYPRTHFAQETKWLQFIVKLL
jgi:hypothetical protein